MAGINVFGEEMLEEPMDWKKFEKLIANTLKNQGCMVSEQVDIGLKFGTTSNSKHIVDNVTNLTTLVECKWQDCKGGGSAEYKVMYDMLTLNEKLNEGFHKRAIVVIGGASWTIFDNCTALGKIYCPKVELYRYEDDTTLSFIK